VDRPSRCVAGSFPGGDGSGQGIPVGQALAQTLPTEDAELALGDIEPASVLGSVMDLELVGQVLGFGRGEGLVERGRAVGVQVVHDQDDPLRVRVVDLHQVLDEPSPVDPGPALGDLEVAPAPERLAANKQVRGASPAILVVLPRGMARGHRQRLARVGQQLPAHLVHTDDGKPGIVGPAVDVQHVLHVPDELGALCRRDDPFLFQPGLERVFLSVRRTVSYETASA